MARPVEEDSGELSLLENRVWELNSLPRCPECHRTPRLERSSRESEPPIQFRVGCCLLPFEVKFCSRPWNTNWHRYSVEAISCWQMTALLSGHAKRL